MLVVSHNLLAINADRQFHIENRQKAKTTEKLSSGYRINRAADDAAGLSISEKMRNQIRGLNQALQNIEEGIDFVRTADGVMQETNKILQRIGELAVSAANDTNMEEDREAMDAEAQELKQELADMFWRTEFNGKKIFFTSYTPEISGNPNTMQILYNKTGNNGGYDGIKINGTKFTWKRIGVQFKEDGVTFESGTYKLKAGGEDVILEFRENTVVPRVSRKYVWSADEKGILINGKLAASWGKLRIRTKDPQPGRYSFSYQGMEIAFNLQEGDTIQSIIDGINNEDFHSEVSWNATFITSVPNDGAYDPVTGALKEQGSWKESDYSDLFGIVLNPPERYLDIQSGAAAGESTRIGWNGMNLMTVGMGNLRLTDRRHAEGAIESVKEAVEIVSAQRAKLGAAENRLLSTYQNTANYMENLQQAESNLRDTDMAEEMVRYSRSQILLQAGQAMIAQANQQNQSVLKLLE